jgi:hypothetical protein
MRVALKATLGIAFSALAVVLAAIGAVSLVKDDDNSPSSRGRLESIEKEVRPSSTLAAEFAKQWGAARKLQSESLKSVDCTRTGSAFEQPFRYRCRLLYGPRLRGYRLNIVEAIRGKAFVVQRSQEIP